MFQNFSEKEIAELRKKIIDYYGTAAFSGMPAAYIDVINADRMSDAEIIDEAKKLNLIN